MRISSSSSFEGKFPCALNFATNLLHADIMIRYGCTVQAFQVRLGFEDPKIEARVIAHRIAKNK
jgi:hypothetical protein